MSATIHAYKFYCNFFNPLATPNQHKSQGNQTLGTLFSVATDLQLEKALL
jgi:hypothetical protein